MYNEKYLHTDPCTRGSRGSLGIRVIRVHQFALVDSLNVFESLHAFQVFHVLVYIDSLQALEVLNVLVYIDSLNVLQALV